MKFSKLPATFRSVLAALVNSGPLRTDKLARIIGTTDCGAAANTLCKMRREGLIFSKEKGTKVYCEWEATNIGLAVFNNRPDDVPLVQGMSAKDNAAAKQYSAEQAKKATAYAVVPDTGFAVGTYEDALECAKAATLGHGKSHIVIAMVAEVLPPVAPQPVVNVL